MNSNVHFNFATYNKIVLKHCKTKKNPIAYILIRWNLTYTDKINLIFFITAAVVIWRGQNDGKFAAYGRNNLGGPTVSKLL